MGSIGGTPSHISWCMMHAQASGRRNVRACKFFFGTLHARITHKIIQSGILPLVFVGTICDSREKEHRRIEQKHNQLCEQDYYVPIFLHRLSAVYTGMADSYIYSYIPILCSPFVENGSICLNVFYVPGYVLSLALGCVEMFLCQHTFL